MTIGKFFLHTQDYDWHKNKSSQCLLLTRKNIKKIIHSAEQYDCHSSIEDLTLENTLWALDESKEIHIVDLTLKFPDLKGFEYGRIYYQLIGYREKVYNFDWINEIEVDNLNLLQKRIEKNIALWSFGCSFTKGIGVENHEKYNTLLSEKLKIPLIDESQPGTSIKFMADKILRADIQKNDIVVWGLTSPARFEQAEDWTMRSYSTVYADIFKYNTEIRSAISIEYFDSFTHFLSNIYSIVSVINFCDKIGAELYLANFMDCSWIPVVFNKTKNFINFANVNHASAGLYIDLGNDNAHPGPLQHQQYANEIYNLIRGN